MIEFEITCYPKSNCEVTLTVKVGKMAEIAPDDKNYDPKFNYGYEIKTSEKRIFGISHHGFKDFYKAQAAAMLRAVSYGNGGFSLEDMLY